MFGKFGGYLAAGTGVIGLILGLVFGGIWAGNASITAEPSVSPSASAKPTATATDEGNHPEQPGDDEILASATASEMKVVNHPDFPEVRYQYQLDFFKLAITNCENLEKNGVVLSFPDGRTAILGKNKAGVISRIDFDPAGEETQRFVPTIEDICMPKYFHDEVLRGFARNKEVRTFYHLDPMGEEGAKQYAWHQHVQSAELSTVYFDFTDGVLTSITDWDSESYAAADLKFGLTKAQKALLQDVEF